MKSVSIIGLLLFFLLVRCKSNTEERASSEALGIKELALVKMLGEIDYEDQRHRREIERLLNAGSSDTFAFREIGKKTRAADSINQLKIVSLLDSLGWPPKSVIGDQGSKTIWAVLQHSDLEIQERYFPLLKKAVKEKNADPQDAAYLEDRILSLGKGVKQKYGTQLSVTVGSTESFVMPLESPEKIDSLRSTVGLPSLTLFLKNRFDMNWNLETYYRDLPKAEKILSETRKQYLNNKKN